LEVMIFARGGGLNFRPPHGPEIVPVLDRFYLTMRLFLSQG